MTQLRRYVSTATSTTLASGISLSDLSLTVVNNSGYPVAPFTIKVEDESMLVTGKTGNVFTVERGYDDTIAVVHALGAEVIHVAIGDDFRNRWLDVTVDRPWGTYDDEFDQATKDAAWVEVTPTGTATWTQANGVMSVAGSAQTANDLAVLIKPFPTLPAQTVETAARLFGPLDSYTMIGLVFTDGTTVNSNAVTNLLYASSTTGQYIASRRSGTLTNMVDNVTSQAIHAVGPWVHMRLNWLTINTFNVEYSPDGVSWATLGLASLALTFTPTHAGMCFSTWGTGNTKIGTFEYFRTQ